MSQSSVKRLDHTAGDEYAVYSDGVGGPLHQGVTVADASGAVVSPATQTTLAAVLAKLSANPATQTKQTDIEAAIGLLAKLTDTQPVIQPNQIVDAGNTAVITSASASGHQVGVPFVGTPYVTTDNGVQETLTLVTAFDAAGDPIPDLGITFNWYGTPEGVSVASTLPPFTARRLLHATDWLSNQWSNYHVEIEPSRNLAAGETVVIATRHSTQTGNTFLYPMNYDFIPSVQTMRPVRAIVSSSKASTYFASFRGAANPFTLSISPTAVTPARVATIWHTAGSIKTVKLRSMEVDIAAASGGTNTLNFALHRTTTAPTGGTTITPAKSDTSDPSAEVACVVQPTVGGTLGEVFMSFAVELTNSSRNVSFTLYDMTSIVPDKSPQLRAGVLEGLALQVTSAGTPTITGIVNMVFTEE